jgi:hypothetical protein
LPYSSMRHSQIGKWRPCANTGRPHNDAQDPYVPRPVLVEFWVSRTGL